MVFHCIYINKVQNRGVQKQVGAHVPVTLELDRPSIMPTQIDFACKQSLRQANLVDHFQTHS